MRRPSRDPSPRSTRPSPRFRASAAAKAAAATSFAAVAAFATMALLASCSARGRTVVALDEAFAATRPELAALLQGGGFFGSGPFGLFEGPILRPLALADGAGTALDAVSIERKRSGRQTSLATSPLVAKAIVGGGSWSGDPPLLVPEWNGARQPGLWSAATDPVPAYRAAGSAAGAFVAALSKGGGSPSCGVVFAESASRPRAALAAFAAAYADASEGLPLYVREIGERSGAPEAKGNPAPAPGPTGSAAASAVAELLGSDIRVLFVALGPDSGEAIRAADRPGLAVGADSPYPEAPRSLAFRIVPDDLGLSRALASELRASSAGAQGGEARTVPALLVAGAGARSIRAGRLDFGRFVEDAALRAKGSR